MLLLAHDACSPCPNGDALISVGSFISIEMCTVERYHIDEKEHACWEAQESALLSKHDVTGKACPSNFRDVSCMLGSTVVSFTEQA